MPKIASRTYIFLQYENIQMIENHIHVYLLHIAQLHPKRVPQFHPCYKLQMLRFQKHPQCRPFFQKCCLCNRQQGSRHWSKNLSNGIVNFVKYLENKQKLERDCQSQCSNFLKRAFLVHLFLTYLVSKIHQRKKFKYTKKRVF